MTVLQKINTFIIVSISIVSSAKGQMLTVSGLDVTITSSLTMTVQGDLKNRYGGTIDNAGIINITGDWVNISSNSVFSTNSGTVMLSGTAPQAIGGTKPTIFDNLILNNSSTSSPQFTLATNQTVSGTLSMWGGNIDLAGNIFKVGTSTSSPGALSYSSGWMYGGTLRRWFNTAAIANGSVNGFFPVGTSTDYRPFYISYPSNSPSTGGTINVEHVDVSGTVPVSFTDIDVTIDSLYSSYWSVTTGNGFTGGTFNLTEGGTGFSGITDYTKLRLTLADGPIASIGTNTGTNASPRVTRTGLTSAQLNNNFFIGIPHNASLPVNLLSFDAKRKQSTVKLDWLTASEINSDYFTIERSSTGERYQEILRVKAAGNSTSVKSYSAIDPHPLSGINYYRLKETDFDGSFLYSLPVTVNFDINSYQFELVSVVASEDKVNLTINSLVSDAYELNLYDCTGKLISHVNGELLKGSQEVSVPCETNAAGVYMINLTAGEYSISEKYLR